MNYLVNLCALINVATNATRGTTELQTQTQPQKCNLKCTFFGSLSRSQSKSLCAPFTSSALDCTVKSTINRNVKCIILLTFLGNLSAPYSEIFPS